MLQPTAAIQKQPISALRWEARAAPGSAETFPVIAAATKNPVTSPITSKIAAPLASSRCAGSMFIPSSFTRASTRQITRGSGGARRFGRLLGASVDVGARVVGRRGVGGLGGCVASGVVADARVRED